MRNLKMLEVHFCFKYMKLFDLYHPEPVALQNHFSFFLILLKKPFIYRFFKPSFVVDFTPTFFYHVIHSSLHPTPVIHLTPSIHLPPTIIFTPVIFFESFIHFYTTLLCFTLSLVMFSANFQVYTSYKFGVTFRHHAISW